MHPGWGLAKGWARACALVAVAAALSQCSRAPSGAPSGPVPADKGSAPPSSEKDPLPLEGFYNNADGSPVLDLIRGARQSLEIEFYQMTDPDVIGAISDALKRGVRVRVVKEPAPVADSCKVFEPRNDSEESLSGDASCAVQRQLRSEILAKGGAYVPFTKATLCPNTSASCVQHGKLLIADGRAALISTGNFNSTNLCNLAHNPSRCNRDFTMIVRTPAVISLLTQVFESDLRQKSYDLAAMIDGSGAKDEVTISPLSLEPLVAFINSAKTRIQLNNQYIKEPTLHSALVAAAARGVKVEITLASLCSFGMPSDKDEALAVKLFEPFDAAGVSLRMMPASFKIRGKAAYMHAKSIIIDNTRAWVGSVNGSVSGTQNNREFGVFFSRPEWVAALSSVMDSDHGAPEMESWRESLVCMNDLAAERLAPLEAPRHVVVITDSHGLGAFGGEIRSFLKGRADTRFTFVASGGAAPLQFQNGIYKTPCGLRDSTESPAPSSFECPSSLLTPKLSALLEKKPQPRLGDTVVIALGANASFKPEDLLPQIRFGRGLVNGAETSGYACVWIGPPQMRRFSEQQISAMYDIIARSIQGTSCKLIDSRSLSHYPETLDPVHEKPDGIHYDYPAKWWRFPRGTEAAHDWGRGVVRALDPLLQ